MLERQDHMHCRLKWTSPLYVMCQWAVFGCCDWLILAKNSDPIKFSRKCSWESVRCQLWAFVWLKLGSITSIKFKYVTLWCELYKKKIYHPLTRHKYNFVSVPASWQVPPLPSSPFHSRLKGAAPQHRRWKRTLFPPPTKSRHRYTSRTTNKPRAHLFVRDVGKSNSEHQKGLNTALQSASINFCT